MLGDLAVIDVELGEERLVEDRRDAGDGPVALFLYYVQMTNSVILGSTAKPQPDQTPEVRCGQPRPVQY